MQSHLGPSTLVAIALIVSTLIYRHEAILDRDQKQCQMYVSINEDNGAYLVMATEHPNWSASEVAQTARALARDGEKFFHLRDDGNSFCDLLPPPDTPR